MPVIGATELQPVNILGSYVQGLEMGRANRLAQAEQQRLARQGEREEMRFAEESATRQATRRNAELEAQLKGHQMIADFASAAVDEPSYQAVLGRLQELGVDTARLPPNFDPQFVAQQRRLALTEAQRIDAELRGRELGVRERTVGVQEKQAQTAANQERRLAKQATAVPTGDQFKVMTPKEIADAGFPLGTVAQKDLKTGKVQVLSAVPAGQRPTAPKVSDPAVNRVEAAVKKLTSQLDSVKTGAVSGVLSRVFDASDAKLFETYREQLSGAIRAALRIPGEGSLSDQEQAQYGLQLPSLGQTRENNIKIAEALIDQVRLAKQMPVKQPKEVPAGQVDFIFKDGRLVPAR